MSSIPNSAMPHARAEDPAQPSRSDRLGGMIAQGRRWAAQRYDAAGRTLGEHPRIALGAVATAVLALAAAALAPRLLRQRSTFAF